MDFELLYNFLLGSSDSLTNLAILDPLSLALTAGGMVANAIGSGVAARRRKQEERRQAGVNAANVAELDAEMSRSMLDIAENKDNKCIDYDTWLLLEDVKR